MGTLEVLFPYFPLPFSFLLSPTHSSPPLSGGNNFNDFPENQPTTDYAFLCKPAWRNATVSPFSLVLISFGVTAFPRNYTTDYYVLPCHATVLNALCFVALIGVRWYLAVFRWNTITFEWRNVISRLNRCTTVDTTESMNAMWKQTWQVKHIFVLC